MSSTARPTKVQRREDARAEAQRLREEQARRARRQRVVVISLLSLGVLALVAVVGFILSNASSDSASADLPSSSLDLADAEDPLALVTAPAGAEPGTALPNGTVLAGGVPVGPDGVAGSLEGAAEDAVVIDVYSDFMCPFCQLFEQSNASVLDDLRESGDAVVVYHPVSILDRTAQGSAFSSRASTAAALVADSSPEAFVDFVRIMFDNQPQEQTAGLTNAEIASIALEAGASDDVVAAIEDGSYMTGDDSFEPWVAAVTEQASRDLPRLATPTILLNGQELSELGVDWRVPGALEAAVEQVRG